MSSAKDTAMKINPLAGKPAKPAMLVNVPRLVTAYYTEAPTLPCRNNGLPSAPRDIVVPHSTRRSMNGISSPSVRPFACTGSSRRSMARCFSAWTRMRCPCRLLPARSRCWRPTGWTSCSRRGMNIPRPLPSPTRYSRTTAGARLDSPTASSSRRPTIRPMTAASNTIPQTAGRRNPPSPPGSRRRRTSFSRIGLRGVKRIPFEKALRAPTTHRHDYLNAYITDLANVVDMDAIRGAKLRLGVDPLGGAGVHYWEPIAERYGLNLTVVNEAVDPTFRFMTVDWDGQIRMDPSSPYAMQRLIGMKDRFDMAFACDTDHDRHGIVTGAGACCLPITTLPSPSSTSSSTGRSGARKRRSAKRW